tara:strand:- start:16 stop:1218 length:1203 start_codon:yes stop_codon:yes gene_type:complete
MGCILNGIHKKAVSKLAGFCFVLTIIFLPSQLLADTLSPEEKLLAIKNSLVNLALESEVRLGAAAFIDADGMLHESSTITSDINVSGVRVMSYLREAGIPHANIDVSIFSDNSCSANKKNIKRQALVSLLNDSSYHSYQRVGDHYINEIGQFLEVNLLKELDYSHSWRVAKQLSYNSLYESFVSSSVLENAGYKFEINLRHINAIDLKKIGEGLVNQSITLPYNFVTWGNPHLSDIKFETKSSDHTLIYELTLKDTHSNKLLWEGNARLHYPKIAKDYKKDIIPPTLRSRIKKITRDFVADASEAIECNSHYYKLAVVSGQEEEYKIYAGEKAGLKIGDQVLLSIDSNIFSQSLNEYNLAGLALATVKKLESDTAVLKHLAGAKPDSIGSTSRSIGVLFN